MLVRLQHVLRVPVKALGLLARLSPIHFLYREDAVWPTASTLHSVAWGRARCWEAVESFNPASPQQCSFSVEEGSFRCRSHWHLSPAEGGVFHRPRALLQAVGMIHRGVHQAQCRAFAVALGFVTCFALYGILYLPDDAQRRTSTSWAVRHLLS